MFLIDVKSKDSYLKRGKILLNKVKNFSIFDFYTSFREFDIESKCYKTS